MHNLCMKNRLYKAETLELGCAVATLTCTQGIKVTSSSNFLHRDNILTFTYYCMVGYTVRVTLMRNIRPTFYTHEMIRKYVAGRRVATFERLAFPFRLCLLSHTETMSCSD